MLSNFIDKKTEAYKKLDPERIYIENVRSFFGFSFSIAKLICEMAVKERIFEKKYGLVCPNCGRIIKSYGSKKQFPDKIECDICEIRGKQYKFDMKEIEIKPFYKLIAR